MTSRGQDLASNDDTRACSVENGQNLLTTHFLASLHVCGTIEGLILAYYDWFVSLAWQNCYRN
jgi:hypothetical protein